MHTRELKVTWNEIKFWAKRSNAIPLFTESEITNRTTPHPFLCLIGNCENPVFTKTLTAILKGNGCHYCSKPNHKNSLVWSDVIERCRILNIEPLFDSSEYLSSDLKYWFRCKHQYCKHEFSKTLTKIIHRDQGCPLCSTGLYQRYCKVAFESLFGVRFTSQNPTFLRYKTGRCLQLDGFNQTLKIAFEHQGNYHEDEGSYFHREEGSYQERRNKDRFKVLACKKSGVILFVIPELETKLPLIKLQEWILIESKKLGVFEKIKYPKVEIDYSRAFRLDPRVDLRQKLRSLGCDSNLSPWIGFNAKYDFFCDQNNAHIQRYYLQNVKMREIYSCKLCKIEEDLNTISSTIIDLCEIIEKTTSIPAIDEFASHGLPDKITLRRLFGKTGNLFVAAGFRAPREKVNKNYLLTLLKERFANQKKISRQEILNQEDFPYESTFLKLFGTLKKACEAAGFKYQRRDLQKTNKRLLSELHKLYLKLGKSPTQTELLPNGFSAIDTYISRFGSFNEAKKLAKVPVNRSINLSKTTIIKYLKDLGRRLSKTPATFDVDGDPNKIISSRTIAEKFGSFPLALKEAGFEVNLKSLRSKKWTNEEMISQLKLFVEKFKRFPGDKDIASWEGPSAQTIIRKFGSRKKYFAAVKL